jgi:beta-mannosidase
MSGSIERHEALTDWQISDCDPDSVSIAEIASATDRQWIHASAPADTYLALFEAGRIPHPHARENEAACAWVAEREWWWRTRFNSVPAAVGERVMLQFDGLDTYADIWLNGTRIGGSDNMFVAVNLDVGALLTADAPNELLVRFTPPSLLAAGKKMETWAIIADPIKQSKRQFHRKAQFGWGWDWGPSLPTVGIWRPVRIERQRVAVIDALHVQTLAIAPTARVEVEVSIDAFASSESLEAVIRLCGADGKMAASERLRFDGTQASSTATLGVDDPQLWWTPELGEATLYTLTVDLCQGGRTLDSRSQPVGIRSIELDTSADADEPGCDFFRFILNGVSIFARGVNWIPASNFVGALTPADYDGLLQNAAAANINMMRVWGGGLYEAEAFYQACDRLGLLVWQDFMFACAPYPEHEPAFVDSVRREVDYQIRRLRNHACLALWCGNNEGQAVHQFISRMTGSTAPYQGDLYFATMIPQALQTLSPAIPYWPGSPYGGPAHNSMRAGDVHNWTVWHGLPPVPDAMPVGGFDHSPEAVAYTRYAEDRARFVSEFGIQTSPAQSTLSRWLAPQQMSLGSDGFLNRIKDTPKNKVDAMLLPVTGLPSDMESYVCYTQLVQAEGLKYGVEHYRRRTPHCSGTLIWQYNDCWPGISWSLIDHDGVRKASYYYVARAYAPVLGSFKQLDDGSVELWVTNDTRDAIDVEATVTLATLGGDTIWQQSIDAVVPATSSLAIRRIDAGRIDASPERVLLLRSRRFADNRLLFAPFKDLALARSEPEIGTLATDDGALLITLTGTGYHHFVHLLADDPATEFSDNYFDLRKAETRTVRVECRGSKLDAGDIRLGCFRK